MLIASVGFEADPESEPDGVRAEAFPRAFRFERGARFSDARDPRRYQAGQTVFRPAEREGSEKEPAEKGRERRPTERRAPAAARDGGKAERNGQRAVEGGRDA